MSAAVKRKPSKRAPAVPLPVKASFDLESCPFCPHGRIIATVHEGPFYYLQCVACRCTGPRQQTKDGARLAWNRAKDDVAAERTAIIHEARRRAAGLRALADKLPDGWSEGMGGAMALVELSKWIAARATVEREAESGAVNQ